MKLLEIQVEYHEELNPKLWDGMELKSEVQKKLEEIANTFIEYVGVDMDVKDILFIGSNTNYNWTPRSDLDLHVVIDMDELDKGFRKHAEEFFKDKKTLFNDHHSIKIYGHPVELFLEDEHEGPYKQKSATVYSIKFKKWVKKPTYAPPKVDSDEVEKVADEWKDEIDDLVDGEDRIDDYDKLKGQFQDERRAAITKGGEFATKNLAFKELRNSGYMDKLKKSKRDKESDELSLKK